MPENIAIEIKNSNVAELIYKIDPSTKELNYETDLQGNFFMIGFPNSGEFAIITPSTIRDHWDHIENGPNLCLKQLIK